ncbi:mechanosensitive ion channel family protein [Pseudomonas syringae pv. actinidiae ICMP 18804]|nr:mechanosensitive ion channel family protein [Pseudomonas syringae pv. actinidiae ICMP 18804]
MVATLGENAITLSLRVWTKTGDMGDVSSMFNIEARDRLKDAGIDIPAPQRMLRVVQE